SDRVFTLAYLNSRLETGIRSPLDAAILRYRDVDVSGYTKLDELPFDFERRRLSIAARPPGADECLFVTKGAAEPILALSVMSEEERSAALARYRELSAGGLRVVAVAHRTLPIRQTYTHEDESGLTFAGFLAFADPILPEVAAIIEQLKADGVTVKILTGD